MYNTLTTYVLLSKVQIVIVIKHSLKYPNIKKFFSYSPIHEIIKFV